MHGEQNAVKGAVSAFLYPKTTEKRDTRKVSPMLNQHEFHIPFHPLISPGYFTYVFPYKRRG